MLSENRRTNRLKQNSGWKPQQPKRQPVSQPKQQPQQDTSKAQKEFPITLDFIQNGKNEGKVDREELKKNAFVVFQKELFVKKFLEKKSAFGYDDSTSVEDIKSKLKIKEDDIKNPSKPFDEFVKQIEKKAKETSSGAQQPTEKAVDGDEEVVESEENVDDWAEQALKHYKEHGSFEGFSSTQPIVAQVPLEIEDDDEVEDEDGSEDEVSDEGTDETEVYDDIEDDVAAAPSQNVVYVEPEVRDFVPSTLVYPDAPPVEDVDEQPLPQDMPPKFDKVSFEQKGAEERGRDAWIDSKLLLLKKKGILN